ncbi:hypothetical protein ABH935_009201 [Catenulispora sp. GAS73]
MSSHHLCWSGSGSSSHHCCPNGQSSPPGANRHDSKLLDPTLRAAREQVGGLPENATVHLNSAYNGKPCQAVLTEHASIGPIAGKGVPAKLDSVGTLFALAAAAVVLAGGTAAAQFGWPPFPPGSTPPRRHRPGRAQRAYH